MIHEESSAPAHPFTEDQDHPHACYEGVVYIGHLVEEDGEEYEAFEAVPCRRCAMGISYGKSKERRSV